MTKKVFIDAWQQISFKRGDFTFAQWVTGITVFNSLNIIRENKLKPDESVFNLRDYNPLDKAIVTLPVNERTVLVLHDLLKYSKNEIADLIPAPVSEVKSRLTDARAQLAVDEIGHKEMQKVLNDYMDEEIDQDKVLEVEAHISGCDGCSEYIYSLRTLLQRMNDLPLINIQPDDLWKSVSSEIRKIQKGEENYLPDAGIKVKSFGEIKKTDYGDESKGILGKIKSVFKKK